MKKHKAFAVVGNAGEVFAHTSEPGALAWLQHKGGRAQRCTIQLLDGLPESPLNDVAWCYANTLNANHYNPNMVFDEELRVLEMMLLTYGWLHPILITPQRTIIDGYHRYRLSLDGSPRLIAKYGGLVPTVTMNIPEHRAMMLTVSINRAKGSHAAVRMAELVKELVDVHGCDPQEVADGIGATADEVALLYGDSIFKARNIAAYRYSKAWEPAEDGRRVQ